MRQITAEEDIANTAVDALSRRGLTPIKLTYDLRRPDGLLR